MRTHLVRGGRGQPDGLNVVCGSLHLVADVWRLLDAEGGASRGARTGGIEASG